MRNSQKMIPDPPKFTYEEIQRCEDVNKSSSSIKHDFVYMDEESFNKYKPASFEALVQQFREYKD